MIRDTRDTVNKILCGVSVWLGILDVQWKIVCGVLEMNKTLCWVVELLEKQGV